MSGVGDLERFLGTDGEPVDCDEVFALLDVCVERQLSHGDAAMRFARVAAHLRDCEPCRRDYEGLLVAAARL